MAAVSTVLKNAVQNQIMFSVVRTSATATKTAVLEPDPEYANAKPFHDIPGPKPLPIPKFGNFWRFTPIGKSSLTIS